VTLSTSKLRVFISWAGKQAETIGQGFREYLPDVVNGVEPFISRSDIDKGRRWDDVLTSSLRESPCAIVCLTPVSLASIWVAFETGAISHAAGGRQAAESRIWTYLLELENEALRLSPFAAYQSTTATEEETFRLVKSINQLSGDVVSADSSKRKFDKLLWPKFSEVLKKAREIPGKSGTPTRISEAEILPEILLTVRSLQHDFRTRDSMNTIVLQPSAARTVISELVDADLRRRGLRLGIGFAFTEVDSDAMLLFVTDGQSTQTVQVSAREILTGMQPIGTIVDRLLAQSKRKLDGTPPPAGTGKV
jgi:hypothetical protein